MEKTPILEIHDLDGIVGEQVLFKALSLSLAEGEKCTLTGASGSGKSTLLKIILGFLPATRKSLYISGSEMTAKSCWVLRRHLAYVAQEAELGSGRVIDILEVPFRFAANRSLTFDAKEALALFDAFLLPADTLHKSMAVLSGGEKQRVALTAALLLKRPLLLLDEVASALDGRSKEAVRSYLAALNHTAILSVSHDVEDFLLSPRVEWMEELGEVKHHADH